MTQIFAIIILAITPLSTDINCLKFKTGTFSLKDETLGSNHLIERTDSTQIETDLKTGTKSKFKVTWINDCEYELNIIEGRQEIMDFFENKTLTVQITKTSKDGYSFKSFIRGTDMVATQTVTRVK